ncbi:MAG TPA: FMN-binding negative transcriptional regulator [Dehalococcoidia bacterium]|nr:FMN-binding negative transcriptional regulator [Dehalococcoidia bacterium]
MYIPNLFREDRPEVLHEVIREHSFATLVSTGAAGLMATHLPLLIDPDRGPQGTLIGHFARANPHWRDLTDGREALAIFQGPHAYISPTWYVEPNNVPTWNYMAVHAYGAPRLIHDEAGLLRILRSLVATYEGESDGAWRMPWPDDYVGKLIRGIVGLEIEITRLEGKFKLSQNRSRPDFAGAVAGLERQGDPTGLAVADLMKTRGGPA